MITTTEDCVHYIVGATIPMRRKELEAVALPDFPTPVHAKQQAISSTLSERTATTGIGTLSPTMEVMAFVYASFAAE